MTAEAHIDREKKILKAAEELFLEKGFALTSTVAIAKKAGCNQALVHYYFRTKDRLVEAVLREKFNLFLSAFMKIDEESDSFEERVRRKVETHFDIMAANPRLPFLIINELAGNPNRIEFVKTMINDLHLKVFDDFSRQLREEIAAGRVRPMAPPDMILTVMSLNAMLFLGQPIITKVFDLGEAEFRAFAQHRKDEHVRIILGSIRP